VCTGTFNVKVTKSVELSINEIDNVSEFSVRSHFISPLDNEHEHLHQRMGLCCD